MPNFLWSSSIRRLALSNILALAPAESPEPPWPPETLYIRFIFSISVLNFWLRFMILASISLIFFLFSSAFAAALPPSLSLAGLFLFAPPPAAKEFTLFKDSSLAVLSISCYSRVCSSLMSSIVRCTSSNLEVISAWNSALTGPPPAPPPGVGG